MKSILHRAKVVLGLLVLIICIFALDNFLAKTVNESVIARHGDFDARIGYDALDWSDPNYLECEYRWGLLIYKYRTCLRNHSGSTVATGLKEYWRYGYSLRSARPLLHWSRLIASDFVYFTQGGDDAGLLVIKYRNQNTERK